jgi:probable F420-dependent oxidoreductase
MVKVDGSLMGVSPKDAAKQAKTLESQGYDGVFTAETDHDPFFPLLLAAEHSETLHLGTAITVAFPRSPMQLAQTAYDLTRYSDGRFTLGLGSQIKAHIEKRFSATWSKPADRMLDYISALRAIWDCWAHGSKLDYRGEFYNHTLMTPFFNPGPQAAGIPAVALAAVGPRMTRVAGQVADGMILHGFTTERYVREVTLPMVNEGLAASGRLPADFTYSCPVFIVTGENDDDTAKAAQAVRQQIAFYGSTPAYWQVLDMHGWVGVGEKLNALSKAGEWAKMGDLITDEMLDAFAIVATPDQVARRLHDRFGDVIERVSFYAPYAVPEDLWPSVIADIKAIG